MAYTKNTWVADETVVSAANLNHMEDGIEAASTQADTNAAAISAISSALHDHMLEGTNLSTVFSSAQAFHTAVSDGDFSKIYVGDYWPITLNGTFRDYSAYTVPSGTSYYPNSTSTSASGTTSEVLEGRYVNTTKVSIKIGGTTYYCNISDCLDYYARTLSNEVVKLEVAGIDNYRGYGTTGDIAEGSHHITLISKDCLPIALQMRRSTAVWNNGWNNTTTILNPWFGSALFQTLNEPDYGVISLVDQSNIGSYIFSGPSGSSVQNGGMLVRTEIRSGTSSTSPSGWAWVPRGKLFLPFEPEIWGHGVWGGVTSYSVAMGLQLPLFSGSYAHIVKTSGESGNRCNWWTSSAHPENATNFSFVGNYGHPGSNSASGAAYVPICLVMV